MAFLHNSFLILSTFLMACYNPFSDRLDNNKPKVDFQRTKVKARQAFEFCKTNKYNTDFCILIDMSIHSGIKRFYVWDFKKDTIRNRFLVSHGCCDHSWNDDNSRDNPKYSNTDGSHCSSLGKYKIGERAYSDWGVNLKYVLHGLDPTNSNAQKRYIVLHSWDAIPDEEIYPAGTPEGWGCPSISNNSFNLIDPLLRSSAKPVLMWIYN